MSFFSRIKETVKETVKDGHSTEAPGDKSTPTKSLFSRLKAGLDKTRQSFSQGLFALLGHRQAIDAQLLEELETRLILADVGIEATQQIMQDLQTRIKRNELTNAEAVLLALQQDLQAILKSVSQPWDIARGDKPYVILMVGVNGVGKTTTIAKLTHHWQQQGLSVLLAAGDTFRAAAVEQLKTWGERQGVPVIAQQANADPAAVIYDALQAATARKIDIVIADTAGRLHTQSHLMKELEKIKRVMAKLDATAPHQTLLVIDASTGQNGLNQAMQFHQVLALDGVILTKLDGTAKGGIIFAIAKKLNLPIRFIGIGEGAEDLRAFNSEEFVKALFAQG